jgi:DNA-binding Lrp family transcriptional regulator
MDLAKLDPRERAFWERYVTTGIHAFWFVDGVVGGARLDDVIREGLIPLIPEGPRGRDDDQRFSRPTVLSAASYIGAYGALVHLWAPPDALAELQDFITEPLGDLQLTGTFALQASRYERVGGPTAYGMKLKKCDVVAIVRVWAEHGRLDDILAQTSDLPGFNGAAMVFGDFDILVEVDASTFEEAAGTALARLPKIEGVVRTETAFADYRRYDPRDAEQG